MNKLSIFIGTVLPIVILSGCSTTSTVDALTKFGNILSDAMPYVKESEEWEAYGVNIAKQGLIYSSPSATDLQFVNNKMNVEYPAAIDRLAGPFARNDKTKSDLAKANQGYVFKYNQVQVVKDKKTSNLLGYCVNYDRLDTGLGKATKEEDKLYKQFIYLAKDKPLSVATAASDFTKLVCGENFYKKYKNPAD